MLNYYISDRQFSNPRGPFSMINVSRESCGKSGNLKIKEFIETNNNFALCRIGLGELRWIDWWIKGSNDYFPVNKKCGGLYYNCEGHNNTNGVYTPNLLSRLQLNGIYGDRCELFINEYIKGISSADLQVFWYQYNKNTKAYDPMLFEEQLNIFEKYSPNSIKIDIESIVPYFHTNFWSSALKGKKVLVVYPFEKTINQQFQHKDKIWTDEHFGKLPDFELKTYKPVWVLGKNKPHNSWYESFCFMRDEISKIDFDIALLGCSHYGLPLVAHIKNDMKKSAIYMGGETQILFGIKGRRWDSWPDATKFYNDYWTRSIDEIPDGANIMDGGSYW